MTYLYTSDSDSDVNSDVKLERVPYEGSHPRRALVEVQCGITVFTMYAVCIYPLLVL